MEGQRRRTGRRLVGWLVLLVAVVGCAQRREPVEMPNAGVDRRIQAELRQRLEAEPAVNGAQVRVEVEAARVRLYGSVAGIGAWNCALRNAWLVQGVEGVADFLVIERGPAEVRCLAVRGATVSSVTGAPGVTLVPRTSGDP
jgi:hypothetical protein